MTGLLHREDRRASLAVAVVILLVAAAVATFLVLRDDGRDPGAVTAGASEGVWDPYAKLPAGGRGTKANVRAQWEPVAVEFAQAFLAKGRRAPWLAGLRPLVSDQLYAQLEEVERRKMPTGVYAGLKVVSSGNRSVDLTVRVEDKKPWLLGVRLVDFPRDDDGWRVYAYEHRGTAP